MPNLGPGKEVTPAELAQIKRRMRAIVDDLTKVLHRHAKQGADQNELVGSLVNVIGTSIGGWWDNKEHVDHMVEGAQMGVRHHADHTFNERMKSGPLNS